MKTNVIQLFKSILLVIILVFGIIITIEWGYRGSFSASFNWMKDFTRQFSYNYLLMLLLFSSLLIFKRKLWVLFTFIFFLPFMFLAIASKIKQTIRGEPVLPSDLVLGSEAINMVEFFSENLIFWLIIALVLLVAVVGFIIYKIPNQPTRNVFKVTFSLIMIGLSIIMFNYESNNNRTYLKEVFNVDYFPWDQKLTYQQDGVVAGFLLNLQWLSIEAPEGYSKERIEKIIEETSTPYEEVDTEKPDIIVIMSEAFWDPTKLGNIEFNKDPLPFFHKLQDNETSGNLIVPVFGGSTVNTEFEFLTGISTQLLPAGSIPYLQYVKKPIPSLPFIFKDKGYETTAIHTWHNWFYSRATVFKDLGFDKFISLEFMENVVSEPPYIHDQTLTDQILKKLTQSNDKPNFIFAVSTLNHGPYSATEKKAFANIEIELAEKQKDLSKESENILEVFSDNLTEVDKELERLINEIQKRDKKTIVVFFGDHLPLLGNDYQVYRETGFYQEDKSYNEYQKMYSTPYLIWDNFSEVKQDNNIGASLLGPIVLQRAGITGSGLTNYINSKFNSGELTKIPRNDFWDQENLDAKITNDLNQLQYDTLFGKMYGVNKEFVNENNHYRLGYANPKVLEVSSRKIDGEKKLIIKGKNFMSSSAVFLDDEKVEIELINDTEIHVPYSGSTKRLKVVVAIVDTNDKILAKSQDFTL